MISDTPRSVAHFDLDAFFVSVERVKNPAFKGRPLIVGGGERGVVAACSYETRVFGVHSAMPIKLARRLCPEALVIKGDMESYSRYSRLVTDIIASKVPLYEKASIDEFYIDLSGMDRYFGVSKFSVELWKYIMKESGLPVSFALASNKLLSKVATNEVKPKGQAEVPFGGEKTYLAPLSVQKLPMVGQQLGERLYQMGVETIRVLADIPRDMLAGLFGKTGIELWRRANGIDETPVIPYHEQKSISTENTFQTDTIDVNFLHGELVRMTERIAFELRSQQKLTGCLTVKVRYSDFQTVTRQATIPYTAADHLLIQKARELFAQLYDRRLLIRLLGVRFTALVPGNYQISLFDDTQSAIRLYQAIDHIKHRFGEDFVKRASGIRKTSLCS